MPSLRDIQSAFVRAVFDGQDAWLSQHVLAGGLAPEARLAIYRNNVLHNYGEALRAVYPVVERLVGEAFFSQAARRYARTCPSTSGDIQDYGKDFPEFLATVPGAGELAYLPDTARLEWLVHEAFHAAGHPPLSLGALAAVPPQRYPELRFALHPSCRLLASAYPVHRIWEVNQPQRIGEEGVDLGMGGVKLLVWRCGFEIELAPLPAPEYALLQAMAGGAALGAACEAAFAVSKSFDVARTLRARVLDGVVARFLL